MVLPKYLIDCYKYQQRQNIYKRSDFMRKILKVFFTTILMSVLCYASVMAVYAVEIDGLGTKASPYIIKNEQQLLAIVKKELSLSAYYKLDNDISLITRSWTPIGANGVFTGNFDGNGHKIANLNIGSTTNSYKSLGLFATNEGTISNLTVEAGTISGGDSTDNIGILVGYNNGGKISNCTTSGTITEGSNVGGIAGESSNEGAISNCQSSYIIDESSSYEYVGGIAGTASGDISNCIFTGTLDNVNCSYAGGIVGSASGDISNCIFTGTLDNVNCSYTGGIAANLNNGNITNCANLSDINIKRKHYDYTYIGGITGYSNSGKISNCYNKANISSSTDTSVYYSYYMGGLIGYNKAAVENCFSIGDISAADGFCTGGLIGYNVSDKYITSCYCVGKVTGNVSDAFAGGSSKNYDNCFYSQTKAGKATSKTAYGLTDDEMKDSANTELNYTFWDFNKTWAISKSINDGYPYLLSMNKPVSGITLSDSSVKIIIGDKKKLTATVVPDTATNKNISWSTSDNGIASVDDEGNVTANGLGSATITVKTEEGNFSAQCVVTVITEDDTDETAIFRIDDMSTIAGQKISVPLRLTKNTAGISALGIDVTYNKNVFKPTAVNTNNCQIFPGLISNINYTPDSIRITASSTPNTTGSGVICYLEFDVLENAEVGSHDLKINVRELKTLSGNVQNDLSYIAKDGKITIEDCVLGDVNGDGQITAADATEVLLNYAGLKDFSIKESTAADVDKNGAISANDATMILLKYAGYDTEW